jgi:hypothetical protein
MAEYEAWSPESSGGDMGSMIEPMYEDDIETMINEVRPEDVQHFDNKQFVRITDEQMPEILKFIDESDQFQFDDWAIIGETKGEDEESIPGSSERPPAERKVNAAASSSKPVAQQLDAAPDASNQHALEDEEEDVEGEEEEEDVQEETEQPNENENSMVFSMFLSNWEDQVRQIREAKRLEWEKRMKELLGNEEDEQQQKQKQPNEKEFVDDDGDSWVLLDNDHDPAAAKLAPKMAALDIAAADTRSTDLQVAVVDATTTTQVARRPGFFESWPSFEVGSKLGGTLPSSSSPRSYPFVLFIHVRVISVHRLHPKLNSLLYSLLFG